MLNRCDREMGLRKMMEIRTETHAGYGYFTDEELLYSCYGRIIIIRNPLLFDPINHHKH